MPCRRKSISVAVFATSRDNFSQLLGPNFDKRARLTEDMIEAVMHLPGTKGLPAFRERADALAAWKIALARGTLPEKETLAWPQEPFKSKFLDALKNLEMARFTRRCVAL